MKLQEEMRELPKQKKVDPLLILNMFQMQNILIAAKMIVIKKLQDIQPLTKTFIQTDKGFEITNPEGFVAVTLDDGAVKLVDRLEFSRQNFLAPKTFGSR